MRTFIIILCILAAAVVAIGVYLAVTTPKEAAALTFPLTETQQSLLAHVPADAEAYGLVPAPVVLMRELLENPVTRDAVTKWTEEHPLPPAAMLGRADAAVWRVGKSTSYAVRFDPVRALIVRTWTMFSTVDAHWAGRTLIVNCADCVAGSPPPELSATQGLALTFKAGADAFIVQRKDSRGAFPPIGRPALTAVRIDAKAIELTSRAAARLGDVAAPQPTLRADLPRSAMLAIAFTDPPRVLGDFDRLVAADVDALVGGGGMVALYKVDTGTLLPRPFAAIVVPANDASRAAVARYRDMLDLVGQSVESNGELVVSFDRNSAGTYIKDARAPVPWPANRWALRMDPAALIPVLRKAGDNPALRFATPRIHRGARDLRRWMGQLEHAESVEAAASVSGGFEELRVRVASK